MKTCSIKKQKTLHPEVESDFRVNIVRIYFVNSDELCACIQCSGLCRRNIIESEWPQFIILLDSSNGWLILNYKLTLMLSSVAFPTGSLEVSLIVQGIECPVYFSCPWIQSSPTVDIHENTGSDAAQTVHNTPNESSFECSSECSNKETLSTSTEDRTTIEHAIVSGGVAIY